MNITEYLSDISLNYFALIRKLSSKFEYDVDNPGTAVLCCTSNRRRGVYFLTTAFILLLLAIVVNKKY